MTRSADDVLAPVQRRCEALARRWLAQAGSFHPFGVFLRPDGAIETLAAHTGTAQAQPQDLQRLILAAFARMAAQDRLRACAVASLATLPPELAPPGALAIRIHLEAPGQARQAYTPYRLLAAQALRRVLPRAATVQFGTRIVVAAAPQVFVVRRR